MPDVAIPQTFWNSTEIAMPVCALVRNDTPFCYYASSIFTVRGAVIS